MQTVWSMLADKDIYKAIEDSETMDNEFLRLLLVELLGRVKRLEEINFAFQALLVQEGLFDENILQQTIKNAGEYLREKDSRKSEINRMMGTSGIQFEEWVNFILKGSFSDR